MAASRPWAGIHCRSDNETGLALGRQAGAASFRPVLAIVLSVLLLAFVGRRRLVAARVVEGVGLLAALPSLGTLLSLLVLGLLWAPPVVRYCRGPRDALPAAPAPDGP